MAATLTDAVIATTLDHYIPKLEDNIFSSKPFLFALRQAGRIQNFHGNILEVPLMYAEVSNKGSYSGSDTFSQDAESGIGKASFSWKQYFALVSFQGIELAKNSGKEQVLSLLRARLQQAELTISENLDEMLLGNGTGNGGKDWDGILGYVGTEDNTVGGIDSTTNDWWNPVVNTTASGVTLALMRSVYNQSSEGNDHPTNILTTRVVFQGYEDLIDDNARFMDPEMADAGFQNLLFKGAPIAYDAYVASGDMYFLNMKYITLGKLNDVWFKASEFLQPTNQDVKYKNILCYGNLLISNRRRQGALTALTNS